MSLLQVLFPLSKQRTTSSFSLANITRTNNGGQKSRLPYPSQGPVHERGLGYDP